MTFGYTDALNQPTVIRLPGKNPDGSPKEVAITDWFWRTLRSTVDILSGAADPQFLVFTYVEGDVVSHSSNIAAAQQRNATLLDTNSEGAAEMPAEQEYLCYALSVDMRQYLFDTGEDNDAAYTVAAAALPIPSAGNVSICQSRLITELEVTQKATFQDQPGWFASGADPFVSGGTTAAVRTYATNGLASKDSIDRAPLAIHIGGTEKFQGIFHNPAALPALDFVTEAGVVSTTVVMRLCLRMVGLQKRPTA